MTQPDLINGKTPEEILAASQKRISEATRGALSLSEMMDKMRERKQRRHSQNSTTDTVPYVVPKREIIHKPYSEWRGVLWSELSGMLKGVRPIIVAENAPIVEQLIRWMTMDPDCSLPLHKGIYLYGDYGSGKSYIMKALRRLSAIRERAVVRTLWSTSYKALKKDVDDQINFFSSYPLCIDDLGYEEQSDKDQRVNNFGTVTKVVQEVIRSRYEIRQEVVTCFTSNKSFDDIELLYGRGTCDRLIEMCTPLHWRGESLRR